MSGHHNGSDAKTEDGLAVLLASLERASEDPRLDNGARYLLSRAHHQIIKSQFAFSVAQREYRALFDAIPDPISLIAFDGTVLDFNASGQRLYGRPLEEVIGKDIAILNPEVPADHLVPVMDALGRGDSYVVKVTNRKADGTRFPVEVHSAHVTLQGRDCILAVARDLSARFEAEHRYDTLVESVDQGIVVTDAEGAVLSVNGAGMQILDLVPGDSPEAGFTSEIWIIVDENGNVLPRDRLPAVIALHTGEPVRSRILGLYRLSDNRFRWLRITAIPQFTTLADRPNQVISIFSDITHLKRDSAMFDRVQQLSKVGTWDWNRATEHLHLSRGALRIFGFQQPVDDIASFYARLQPADATRLAMALSAPPVDDVAFTLELRGWRVDGAEVWVRMQGETDIREPSPHRLTGTFEDITEHKHIEQTLRAQARTDALTGLLNRDAIHEELEAYLAGSDPKLAVLYIDLDRFKVINDALGHAVGDKLLIQVARRLQDVVAGYGECARLGGDEFLVICKAGTDQHLLLAERILHELAKPFQIDAEDFTISASVGIAESPADSTLAVELVQQADAAMYESKRRSNNGWQHYSEDLARSQREKLQLDQLMRGALANKELHLVYQPQLDLHTGRVIGAEALMRWNNPLLGTMRPDVFIGRAESTGEIVRLGAWALHETCRQVREWLDAGLPQIRVAVNVSYRQFIADDLVGTVMEAMQAYRVPPRCLELEFTERVLIEDAPETTRIFQELDELGVSLAIDDFGEGYSGLNYLRRLPIHVLKLSQLFIKGVPGNASDVAVCEAVAGIARGLRMTMIAEGVETDMQRRYLVKLGVPVGQGFFFSPALTPQRFVTYLRAHPGSG